jgi:GNAT superfamily N-acetyltransferase
MLDECALAKATLYWAQHLGCEPGTLFATPSCVVAHSPELADYNGVFALFRDDSAIISVPKSREKDLRPLLPGNVDRCAPEALATALAPVTARVIGPAFIGYAAKIAAPGHGARMLKSSDAPALHQLQNSCDPVEWEHGGSAIENSCSGVFIDGQLAALAGYEIWGGGIAHISIITHPEFRGRGLAQSAVAHVAAQAITAGLLLQYRTLEANTASIRIAENLGFLPFARSLAIRLSDR